MGNYFLGLDYGTGGCKGCIIDEEAEVLSYAYRKYEIITGKNGESEHDAGRYWPLTCEIIKECIQKAGISSEEIRGIGTSSALPSLVMIDGSGDPVHPAYNLMDRRAYKEMQMVLDTIGEAEIYRLTGNRIEDHPVLINLLWEKKNRPEEYSRINKALTIDGYIRYKLTGTAKAHYSSGTFYGVAYDVRNRCFSKEILDRLGIEDALLPELCRCEDIVGVTTDAAAKESGLVSGILVAGGQVDCNAGWIGGGAIEEGDVQMNLGTCGNFGVIHSNADQFMPQMFNIPYTSDSEHTFITIATTTTGGQSLRYIQENFSQLEVAMEHLVKDFDSYDYLNMEAEKISIGCDGLIVLPYLMGERTPIWDNDARGVVFGLSLNHTKAHFVRAMMESVAYALYDSFQYFIKAGIKVNYPIVMNEGGAKSRLWRQIITDVFNVPTVMLKSRVGAPYGDALLAAVAAGYLPDYRIAKEKAEYVERLEPNQENHKKYQKCFALYKSVYEDLKLDFQKLKILRDELK